jgi:hypothetical protein
MFLTWAGTASRSERKILRNNRRILILAALLGVAGAPTAGAGELPERRVYYPTIIIEIYVNGGTKTGAEIRATGDSWGCYSFSIHNVHANDPSYFRGERGRPLLNYTGRPAISEEGKRFYIELTARLAAVKPRLEKGDGDVVVSITRFYPDSEGQEVDEWPEATYDVEPLLSFLRDFMAEHSPGEISFLEKDGYVRLYDPESPKRVTGIKFSPLGEFVHVDINDAAGFLRLPARVAAYGSVCEARKTAVDIYLFGRNLRCCVAMIEARGPAYHTLDYEIFLPFDDEALEYSGPGGPGGTLPITYDLKSIIDNFVEGCFEKAYYPKSVKKGLQFKKELQRRKKKDED